MKRNHHLIILFLLLSLLATHSIADERIYKATRAADSKWAFVGGSACCDCVCDSEGKLPTDFPSTDIHAVTFYLMASRSSSVFDKIKVGPTKLKLILGISQSVALTAARSTEIMDPVKHTWYVTFTFSPPVKVGPGSTWKLLDGDGTWKSAAVAHTSDKPSGGLPGKFITKNCQYAKTENHWYSVKFDFAAAEPVPSEGLKIVEKARYDISVQLNGKEIYSAPMFDVGIVKSFKNIDGSNVDVLVENAGGNICQTYSCRIISWRPDGQYKISDKFGNCQGPKISQEGNKIYLAFESYTMRHSGKTAPAQNWVYENGVLRKAALPGLYPRPVLQSPQKNAVMPQENNPDCPKGYIWNFSWTIPDPQNIKHYQIRVTKPWLKDPILKENVHEPKFVWSSCTPIKYEDLERWRWQVRAFYRDEKWSEWSDGNDFHVAEPTTIKGIVSDTSGNALVDVTVTEAVSGKSVLSGSDGSFRISDLTPDTQASITFSKDGYFDQSRDITLKRGSNPASAKLSPAAELRCTILDQSKNPIWGVTVEVAGTQKSEVTTEDGTCTISELPADVQSEIICSLVGYQTKRDFETLTQGSNALTIVMTALAYIRGYVTDADGQTIAGAAAAVEGTDKSCLTGETGYYKLQFFTPDTQVTVTFSKDDYLGKSEQITLQPGENFLSISLGLPASVSGIITDEGGGIISGVTVSVEGTEISSSSQADGYYNISGLAPNTPVTVIFSKDGYLKKNQDITLQTGANSLSIVLGLSASVSGTVTDGAGNVLSNVTVRIDGTDISATTGDDGSYTISELKPDDQLTVLFSKDGYLDTSGQITLQPGDNPLSKSLYLMSSVSGVITDEEGGVMDGVTVSIQGTDISSSSGADGNYEISDLTPNTQVTVIFSKDGYVTRSLDKTLQPGTNSLPAMLELSTAYIAGIVKDIGDYIVSTATVTIEGTDKSATTGDDGSYTISGLSQGTQVNVMFKKDGYLDLTKDLTLNEGENSLSVSLIPPPETVYLEGFPKTEYGNDHPEIEFSRFLNDYKIVGEWKDDSRRQQWQLKINSAWLYLDYENQKVILNLWVYTDNRSDKVNFYLRTYTYRYVGWSMQKVLGPWKLLAQKKMPSRWSFIRYIWFADDPGWQPVYIKK